MNTSNINGDLKIVMGSPMPTEDSIDIPPRTAAQKVIEEGEIEISVANNTPEIIAKLNEKHTER